MFASLLSGLGLFALVAYTVAQRTRELGIRIAVGARARHIVRWVMGVAAPSIAVGLAAGIIAVRALGEWMSPLLYDIEPDDPIVALSLTGLIALIAAAATLPPVLRALRIHPAAVLRLDV
jgi:ABC-type antimicrobial peptide transport system permease subunit